MLLSCWRFLLHFLGEVTCRFLSLHARPAVNLARLLQPFSVFHDVRDQAVLALLLRAYMPQRRYQPHDASSNAQNMTHVFTYKWIGAVPQCFIIVEGTALEAQSEIFG